MICPIGHRVLLQRCRKPETSDGGIVIPPQADDNLWSQFLVRAIGPKVKDILPGHRVYCQTYAGQEVAFNGKKHRLVEDSAILAILTCP